MGKNYEIFISYSSKDKEVVTGYSDYLQSQGYEVWIDHEGISHGHTFPNAIASAIQNSRLVLFFSSRDSNASKWVKREIVFADNHDKTIIPIKLDDSEYDQSLQLLLSGVEHINASQDESELVKQELLKSIIKEIGPRSAKELCPVISKPCPVEKVSTTDPYALERINEANRRMAFRNRIRSEAFVFTALCEGIWLILFGLVLMHVGVLTHSLSMFIATVAAYFLSIYTTHMSTNSFYVPGWYNRHLTTYGALIIAMDFFVTAGCLSIASTFSINLLTALCFFVCSLIGLIGMACIFRLKKAGYYLLWLDTVLFTASSYSLWSENIRIWGMAGLFLLLVLAMLILTSLMKLRYNGSSTWGLLFGKETDGGDSSPSAIERFLLGIWFRIYR